MRFIREIFNTTFADPAVVIRMTFENIFCPPEGAKLKDKIERQD